MARTNGYRRGELRLPGFTAPLARLSSVPICAYVGYNGMGKSAAAASVAMMHLAAGRPVLSTARLIDWENPRPCPDNGVCEWPSHDDGHLAAHPLWRPFTDYRQLFSFRDGHVWADEATGIADARSSASLPGEVADYLPRMRAAQVTFHWTTIHWSFADVRLRRVTWAAVWAAAFLPTRSDGEIWARNRAFFFRAYDARNLGDDFDPADRDGRKYEAVRPLLRSVVWGPRWGAWEAYDSLDAVSSLGGTDQAGMCLVCGGHRGRKRCSGHDDDLAGNKSRGRGRADD